MDFGNYGGGVCEAAASDPSSATVANLLSSSGGGASNGAGLGVPAFTKSTVSRSAVPEPDFGKPRTQDDRSADGSVLKIPFELRQQQQNHHSGGSGNSSSDGSAQQLQLLGRAHNSGGAAGIVGDVVSPWAVHALLQHQSYSPFRASAGMPPLPMAMTPSVMGVNGGGGTAGAMNVQRGGSYCFTPMQWQELEHQALIYKYILAEQPVPPELLIPIKRSLAGAADYLHHQPNLVGWNSFQMRFANVKADAEPGRCRRTDGKKWRCSRDAAPDQKYCERHMHRGRPRSRKPVEGGHTAAINGGGGNSSSNNNNSNNTSVSTSAATSSSASATAAAQSLNNNNSSIIGGNPASSCNGSSSPSSFGSLASVSRSSVSSSVRPAATTDSSRAAAAAAADQFLNLKSLTTAAASTASINGGLSHFKSPLNMVKDYRYMNWMKGDNGNVSSSSEDHQLLLSDTHGSSKSHHHHHHHNHHHHHLSNNSGSSNSNSCTTTDAQTHHQNQNQHIVAAAAAAAAAASNLNPAAAAAAAANNWRCWGPPSTKLNMSSSAAQHAMLQQYSRSLMGSSSSHSHNINHHSCNLSDFSVLQDQQNLSHHSSNNNNTQSLFLTDTQQPLRHFIDDWGAAAAAAAEEHSRSTATQLSMSSMAASTDLGLGLMNNNNSTTTNTNTNDRHSHHSTNNNNNHRCSSSNSYVPVALGGPLAEVLQHNSAAPVNPAAAAVAAGLCRPGTTAGKASAGALNLLSNEVWELSSTSPQESPRMASSPTGVLQKTLASLSDSSSGSTAAAAVKHDTLHNLASV